MSKIIGIIAEDTSDVDVITNLIAKYVDRNRFAVRKFVGNGCSKLRNKCGSWATMLFEGGCHHVLVFHDLDRNDEAWIRSHLLERVPKNVFPNSLIVVPIEEIEAWLLSDESAVREVFGLKKTPPRISNCEAITSPKEHLERLVWSIGRKRYLNTTHNNKISMKVSIANLRRCSSYRPLDNYIVSSIFKLATKKRR